MSSNRIFDLIAMAVGLGVLIALAKAAEAAPPPVPPMPTAAQLFAQEFVSGTL